MPEGGVYVARELFYVARELFLHGKLTFCNFEA
jgi:hypothetical protein